MTKTMQKIALFISLFIYVLSIQRKFTTNIDNKELTYTSSFLIDEDTNLGQEDINISELYDIGILAVNGAKLTINTGIKITKTVQNSNLRNLLAENGQSFAESDDYIYGLTSAIVAIGPSTEITINNAIITIDCPFSNAFVALNNAKITIRNTTIITKNKYSKGIIAMNHANMEVSNNFIIKTYGDFSPCIEVNKGKGDILAFEAHLFTCGEGSPLINTVKDGKLQIIGAEGRADNSPIIIIKGDNTVLLHDCKFTCKGKGNQNIENNYNKGGIIVFNSEDYHSSIACLQLFNCEFSVDKDDENIPMFSCYNTEIEIVLDNTQTSFNNIFMIASHIDEIVNDTKINLVLYNYGFEGKIISKDNSLINIKATSELIKNIEKDGNVIIND
jgi:hypothetical protein